MRVRSHPCVKAVSRGPGRRSVTRAASNIGTKAVARKGGYLRRVLFQAVLHALCKRTLLAPVPPRLDARVLRQKPPRCFPPMRCLPRRYCRYVRCVQCPSTQAARPEDVPAPCPTPRTRGPRPRESSPAAHRVRCPPQPNTASPPPPIDTLAPTPRMCPYRAGNSGICGGMILHVSLRQLARLLPWPYRPLLQRPRARSGRCAQHNSMYILHM